MHHFHRSRVSARLGADLAGYRSTRSRGTARCWQYRACTRRGGCNGDGAALDRAARRRRRSGAESLRDRNQLAGRVCGHGEAVLTGVRRVPRAADIRATSARSKLSATCQSRAGLRPRVVGVAASRIQRHSRGLLGRLCRRCAEQSRRPRCRSCDQRRDLTMLERTRCRGRAPRRSRRSTRDDRRERRASKRREPGWT